jgi:hypothetical protein
MSLLGISRLQLPAVEISDGQQQTALSTVNCQLGTLSDLLHYVWRLTVSWPHILGVGHRTGAHGQIFVTVRQLWGCWYGLLCLAKMRICNLKLLLDLTSMSFWVWVLWGLRPYFAVSNLRIYQHRRPGLIIISPRNGGPGTPPDTGFHTHTHTHIQSLPELGRSQSHCNCQSVRMSCCWVLPGVHDWILRLNFSLAPVI